MNEERTAQYFNDAIEFYKKLTEEINGSWNTLYAKTYSRMVDSELLLGLIIPERDELQSKLTAQTELMDRMADYIKWCVNNYEAIRYELHRDYTKSSIQTRANKILAEYNKFSKNK